MPRTRRAFLAGVTGLVAGCGTPSRRTATPHPTVTVTGTTETVRYTHLRPSGNRRLHGAGRFDTVDPIDIAIERQPQWLAGLPVESGSLWVAVPETGAPEAVRVSQDGTASVAIEADLPAGQPPAVALQDDGPQLLTADETGPNTHAVEFPDGAVATVTESGAVLVDGDLLIEDALPDARIVWQDGTAAVLAGATQRYDHGALGDGVEASAIVLFAADGSGSVRQRVPLLEPAVVEGTAPILADVDDDGDSEVLVTVTGPDEGARLAAYGLDGERVATGPAIGTGFRWRHQLCVAPFTPDGPPEIAVVRTPHIGGTVEFYRVDGDRLSIAARHDGVSSHTFGSRILDGGLAGDLLGDGRQTLLVPTQERRRLVALQREDGVRQAARRDIGASLTSNVAATPTGNGGLSVAVGRSDSVVRVWQ
ncbi:hypothetical protein SAMN05443574_10638 [Haloarcula vallismortis]|uniref:FG-GAP repeat-containing protein n=2 Tax=Haloarcula vallismortis TaxID=28442 RepID=M0JFJ3_HALVA|nr:hypothetical protein [Haloarcula vallismortis]EMA07761.1 hypothetical protein C437_09973 [Haloarcula vallismortis ATCC 29715]SDW71838.1 hypothetical protein SAMN05443574_10638 [Haloarcula vallismortis]